MMIDLGLCVRTLTGMVIYWLIAAGHLVIRDRDSDNLISSLLFFSIGLYILVHGLLIEWSFLIGLHIGFIFVRAPLFYFYFQKIIDPEFRFTTVDLRHFLPGLIIFLLLAPMAYGFFGGQVSHQILFNNPEFQAEAMIITILMGIGYILNVVYLVAVLIKNKDLFFNRDSKIRRDAVTSLILLQVVVCATVASIAGVEDILHVPGCPIACSCVALFGLVFYFSIIRYPRYMRLIKEETRKVRYAQSRIHCLNLTRIFRQIEKLMQEEKVYLDENLSLDSLAEMLEIAPQQLSEILNNKMNKNFYTYINEYRIDEAKRLLVDNPEAKIIDIGFDVGFNTKSAFYTAFKKLTDLSPGEFRKARVDYYQQVERC